MKIKKKKRKKKRIKAKVNLRKFIKKIKRNFPSNEKFSLEITPFG